MGLDLAMLKLFGIKMIVIRLINILRHLVIGLGCQRFAVREYSHFQYCHMVWKSLCQKQVPTSSGYQHSKQADRHKTKTVE